MSTPDPAGGARPPQPDESAGLSQEQRYDRIAELRAVFDDLDRRREKAQHALFREIRDAFPETRGEPKAPGALTTVTARSRYTREYVARVRDGKITIKPPEAFEDVPD